MCGHYYGHLYVVYYVWCRIVNWERVGHVEHGMTQKQLPCGAAYSASTSDHIEQQVCKY